MFAGIVLVAANLFGFGVIAVGLSDGQLAARAAVVPYALPAEDASDPGPLKAEKDSGPAALPAPPRSAQLACHDAGCSTPPVPAGDHHPRLGRDHTNSARDAQDSVPPQSAHYRL